MNKDQENYLSNTVSYHHLYQCKNIFKKATFHGISYVYLQWGLLSNFHNNICNPYQGSKGVYREIPVIKTGFSLWELTYREYPVSLTGFGFAVWSKSKIFGLKNIFLAFMTNSHFPAKNEIKSTISTPKPEKVKQLDYAATLLTFCSEICQFII